MAFRNSETRDFVSCHPHFEQFPFFCIDAKSAIAICKYKAVVVDVHQLGICQWGLCFTILHCTFNLLGKTIADAAHAKNIEDKVLAHWRSKGKVIAKNK
jgi:hypothetical protein